MCAINLANPSNNIQNFIYKSRNRNNQIPQVQQIPQTQQKQNITQNQENSSDFKSRIKKFFVNNSTKKTSLEEKSPKTQAALRIMTFMLELALIVYLTGALRKPQQPKQTKIWEDVSQFKSLKEMALPEEMQKHLSQLINIFKNPYNIKARGGEVVQCAIFYGQPGTGKTTYAKALAKELGAKFTRIDMSELNSQFHGMSEKNLINRVNKICKEADSKPNEFIVVLIDEMDKIAKVDDGLNGKLSNDILATFKTCLSEKLQLRENIIVIGTTNFDPNSTVPGEKIDKAIVDRFKKQVIEIKLPTKEQIKEAIHLHYKNCPLVEEILKTGDNKNNEDLDKLAENLADKKISFRDLETIFTNAASSIDSNDSTTKVGIKALIEASKSFFGTENKKIKIGFDTTV